MRLLKLRVYATGAARTFRQLPIKAIQRLLLERHTHKTIFVERNELRVSHREANFN